MNQADNSKYKLISPKTAGESQDLLSGKSSDESLRRIQALLADWLRMENLVVLTAAGTSVDAGGKLMAGPRDNNLECLVLDAVENCDISDNTKKIVIERKSLWEDGKSAGREQLGFEGWLSYLFGAEQLTNLNNSPLSHLQWRSKADIDGVKVEASTGDEKQHPDTPSPLVLTADELKKLNGYIEKAIYAELAINFDNSELIDNPETTTGHISFLAKLISRDSGLGRTHLFTLNYDTMFEQTMEELGIHYFDGFVGKANSKFDPSVYGLDLYFPGDVAEGKVRRYDKFLQFYKLHGSLHWYVDDKGTYRARHSGFDFLGNYRDLEPAQKAEKLQSKEYEKIGSYGIMPTSQKFIQTLEMPFAHLFRLLHARLHQPQTFLLVLGYGFGDEHVNRIIESALSNPSLVMLVVEPNSDSEIVKRIAKYQSLGQRAFVLTENAADCTYSAATFRDFAENVLPDVKWLEDYKRLRNFEREIENANRDRDGL